jgi:hypothetical protein
VALPFFGHASVAFTAVRSGSASGNTHFEIGRVRPVHTCAYVSPRHYWSCRKAHFRLRGLAWPDGSLTPLDDSTEFQFFILFLLSVQHFLVTPHVGAVPAPLVPRGTYMGDFEHDRIVTSAEHI